MHVVRVINGRELIDAHAFLRTYARFFNVVVAS